MSLIKQAGLSLLILLLLGLGGYWYTGGSVERGDASAAPDRKRPPPLVDVAPALSTMLSRKVEAVGTTKARQSVDIRPAASGRVQSIDFLSGSQVEEGSTLVRLDDIIERADIDEAEAERREAKLKLERAKALVERKSIPQATVEELEAAFAAAEARVERARKQLDERSVLAPFAGRIGMKQIDVGARVYEDTVISTLDDLVAIQVEFAVPEIFFGAVAQGQKITATSDAFDKQVFEGIIETVDSRIDRVSRSFQVRASIPNDDFVLPAGMFMLVELTLAERTVVTVPEEAVMVSGDQARLFVIEDGKAIRREVVLGQREIGLVEIVDGLEADEQVVVKGIQQVRPGVDVRITSDGADEAETPGKPDAEPSSTDAKPNV